MLRSLNRIGILGHVGTGNLGDEAIITAVIQNLRRRCPESEICAFTSNPEDTQERHRVPAFPLRRGRIDSRVAQQTTTADSSRPKAVSRFKSSLKRARPLYRILKATRDCASMTVGVLQELAFIATSYRYVKHLDLLIIAGSHQLNDFVGGAWAFPYTLLKWTLMARLAGARVAFLSVGAGPVSSRLGKQFIRWTLALACYRSFRDERSRDLVSEIGSEGKNLFVPDLAFSLSAPEKHLSRLPSQPVIGINPLPFFDSWYWYKSDDQLYRQYVRKIASAAELAIDNGYAVWLFPTQLRADPLVIEDVRSGMSERYRHHLLNWPVQNFEDLVAGISACRFVIATRYHGILVSLLLNTPVLALAYHGKSKDLMRLLDQDKYVLDAACWDLESLPDLFFQLDRQRRQITEQIALRLSTIRGMLAAQYDAVLGQTLPQSESSAAETFGPPSEDRSIQMISGAEGAIK
ncbi:MAG: hypothetical protein DMG15_02220 [Acidobacteria bacterium]|nr:MAG: hypothetical protein DMG15_02220 [Acidobacteriota bacterium]